MISVSPKDIKIKPGYIGFSYRTRSIVSEGIAYFTKEEHDTIIVTHTFLVVDDQHLIEAAYKGVNYQSLGYYFYDPSIVVFFKKPKGLTSEIASVLIEEAKTHVGEKYDFSLYLYFLEKTLLSWFIDNFRDNKKPAFFNTPKEFICSELVGACLNKVDEYSKLKPLSEYHVSRISPMDLFRSEILEEWSYND